MIRVLALFVSAASLALAASPRNLLTIQTDEHHFRTLGRYRDRLTKDRALIWGEDAVVETHAIDSIARRVGIPDLGRGGHGPIQIGPSGYSVGNGSGWQTLRLRLTDEGS